MKHILFIISLASILLYDCSQKTDKSKLDCISDFKIIQASDSFPGPGAISIKLYVDNNFFKYFYSMKEFHCELTGKDRSILNKHTFFVGKIDSLENSIDFKHLTMDYFDKSQLELDSISKILIEDIRFQVIFEGGGIWNFKKCGY